MPERGGVLYRNVLRASYFLGAAVGRTVRLVGSPLRLLPGRAAEPSRRAERPRPKAVRRPELSSRLRRIDARLRSIERTLLAPDGFGPSVDEPDASWTSSPAAPRSADEDLPVELFEALADGDPGIRQLALGTLAEFSSDRAVGLIIEALHDPDSGVRCAAAAAAAEAGASGTVFSLILALADPSLAVRRSAAAAIERISGQKIQFDPAAETAARQKQIGRLKDWWKEERVSRLAAEVESVLEP